MKILIDSCIWSLALRRKVEQQAPAINELKELIQELRIEIIGAVRQEILSGIKSHQQFQQLRSHLASFTDLPLTENDFELAAEYFNLLRSKGIQGSNTDFLICAVSTNHNIPIFTQDKDFEMFSEHIPIQLHQIRKSLLAN